MVVLIGVTAQSRYITTPVPLPDHGCRLFRGQVRFSLLVLLLDIGAAIGPQATLSSIVTTLMAALRFIFLLDRYETRRRASPPPDFAGRLMNLEAHGDAKLLQNLWCEFKGREKEPAVAHWEQVDPGRIS